MLANMPKLNAVLRLTNKELTKQIKRYISNTSSAFNIKCNCNSNRKVVNKETGNKLTRLSQYNSKRLPVENSAIVSKEEKQDFMAIFPNILHDLTDVACIHADIPEVTKRFVEVLQYNVLDSKKDIGLVLVATYKLLEDPNNLTTENIRLANVMGWYLEMLNAYFLILDDIMDGSETRRGVPCWYKKENIGLSALNDAIMLNSGMFSILKRHFFNHPCYVPAFKLFNDVMFKTSMGQAMDIMCLVNGKPNLDAFSKNRYNKIVKYKTAYYFFQLPVALAMYLTGKFDLDEQAKKILLKIGQFYQIQDDFLDCFGNPEVTGKIGTDIREGKCSWLAVVALQKASPKQRAIMEEYYGKFDPEAITIIKNLYEELDLPNIYLMYKEKSYNKIRIQIEQISKSLPRNLFFNFLNSIYEKET